MQNPNFWRRALAVAAVLVLAGTGSALAQYQTGNLYGTVQDNQGQVLPGVTVTLTGIGAAQVQVTNAQGEFRFLNLAPGGYSLKAELEGFSTVDYPNITIAVGRNTTIEVTLSAAVEEVITVTSESPLLDERKISTGTTVTQTELEKIPTARDPWIILQQTPGVLVDRVNVGGSEGGQQSLYISPGTDDGNSAWAVDGVTITDMGAIGSSPTYYNFDSFEEMQVTTGGTDTSLATGGVVMNMVTKRGTNEWRFSGRYLLTDDTIDQADTSTADGDLGVGQGLGNQPICPPGVRPNVIIGGLPCVPNGTQNRQFAQGNRIVEVTDWGGEGGGPIVRDKAWIWGSYGIQEIDLLTVSDFSDFTELESYAVKLNAQVTTNNSLTAFYHFGDKVKIGRNAGPTRPQETTWNQSGGTPIYKIEDTHIFNSNFYLTGMASYVDGGFKLDPQGGGIGSGLATDNAIRVSGVWANSFLLYDTERPQEQAKVDGNYFFNTGSTSHELRFGVGLRNAEVSSFSTWPGQQAVGLPASATSSVAFAFVRTDRNVSDEVDYTNLYVQDTMTFGNFTANVGLRYDLQEPTNNPAVVLPAPASVNQGILIGGTFAGGDPGFEWESITPRLGLTYALGEDRETLLRLSYSRFADQMGSGTASFVNPSNYSYGYFYWYDDGDLVLEPSEHSPFVSYGGAIDPRLPGQLITPNRVDGNLDAPITDEIVASVEHALLPEFVIGASVTWRKYSDILEFERLVCDDPAGTGLCAPGFTNSRPHRASDYVLGITHTGTLPDGSTFAAPQFTLRDGVVWSKGFLMENGDREQDYLGASFTFNKRLANRWLLRGHVTWQDWEWSVPGSEEEDPTHDIPGNQDGDPVLLGSGTGSGAKGGIYINQLVVRHQRPLPDRSRPAVGLRRRGEHQRARGLPGPLHRPGQPRRRHHPGDGRAAHPRQRRHRPLPQR
jgi:hypothetical protein